MRWQMTKIKIEFHIEINTDLKQRNKTAENYLYSLPNELLLIYVVNFEGG
jgi:hypothetical protein